MVTMRRIVLFPLTGFGLALAVSGLLLVSNLYTYERLTDEAPIAELRFLPLGPQRYQARVAWGDFCEEHSYLLDGDAFRLDARFLKWRPWANLLGFDALYRMERLGGRYNDVTQENRAPPRAFTLNPDPQPDLPAVLARFPGILSPVDTLYGSSVYADMQPGFLYRVYRSQSGLLVRKIPLPDSGGITIDIRRACSRPAGFWQRLGAWLQRRSGQAAAPHPAGI
jgi:hypothetical protein